MLSAFMVTGCEPESPEVESPGPDTVQELKPPVPDQVTEVVLPFRTDCGVAVMEVTSPEVTVTVALL